MTSIRNIHGKSRIRLGCSVVLMSGIFMHGYTRELSVDGVSIQTQGFSLSGRQPPRPGESGVLTLHYRRAGKPQGVRVHCHLVRVVSCGLELNVTYSELSASDQEILKEIMESGSDRLS
ncbi:MAG: PilZ domain-containing protein [Amphritea sp.]